MGRGKGKLKVELISDRKIRQLTFKRRNENLVKKIKELNQLSDVDACMIVYSPDHHGPVTVCGDIPGMVDLYRAKKAQDFNSGVETFGVSDFHNKEQLESAKPGELVEDYSSLFFDYGNYQLYDPQQETDENVNSSTEQKCCAMEFDMKELEDEYWAGGYVQKLCTPPPQPVMLW